MIQPQQMIPIAQQQQQQASTHPTAPSQLQPQTQTSQQQAPMLNGVQQYHQQQHQQQQQQPTMNGTSQTQIPQQHTSDDTLNQIFNPMQLSIFKCQIHAYKLFAKGQMLPDHVLTLLKQKVGINRQGCPQGGKFIYYNY
jgi:hypothetical protein